MPRDPQTEPLFPEELPSLAVEDEQQEGEAVPPETKPPFDPTKIRIETKTLTVDLLLKRLKGDEIDLSPGFQRTGGLWTPVGQSRLIESLLVRIPIPAFYMDAKNDDKWLVVDGLQRLTTLKRFVIEDSLALTNLEFLTHLHGSTFSTLPRPMQRRIEETQVTVSLIQPGTPPEVEFNIFRRINTGGLPLSPQEIRHALNQGKATEMLKELAALPAFAPVASSLTNERMADRECVLRFLAFALTPYREYTSPDLDDFLNRQLKRLNAMTAEQRAALTARFTRALEAANLIFGRHAFRKRYSVTDPRRKPINKPLFEAWTVSLDALTDTQLAKLAASKDTVNERLVKLLDDRDFEAAITQATGDIRKVHLRFAETELLIRSVLQEAP